MLAMDMVVLRQQAQHHHKTHSRCNKIPLQCQTTLLLQLTFKWQCSNNSNNRWWWCIKVPTITLIPMIIISSQLQVLLLLTLLETISLPSHLLQAHLVRCSSKTAIIICSSRVINKSCIQLLTLSCMVWVLSFEYLFRVLFFHSY